MSIIICLLFLVTMDILIGLFAVLRQSYQVLLDKWKLAYFTSSEIKKRTIW